MSQTAPALDEGRFTALKELNLLETRQDPELDEVAELAGAICETPIAIITLLDRDWLKFKSQIGIELPSLPIDSAICAHTIAQGSVLEIQDTHADARTLDNAICKGENAIRFYAGAPLITSSGISLGALCVLDTRPKRLTDLQKQALTVLSRQVMVRVELTYALQREVEFKREIDHRVKNSLQTISSSIAIERERTNSPETTIALDYIDRHVEALALLHRELYNVDEETIDLLKYMTRLTHLIRSILPENISLLTEIDPVIVSSKQAASVGIIINEFTTNSMKHAFPDNRDGEIKIELTRTNSSEALLYCEDNGVGTSESSNEDERSLGLLVLSSAAAQLEAAYSHGSQAGKTWAEFVFKSAD